MNVKKLLINGWDSKIEWPIENTIDNIDRSHDCLTNQLQRHNYQLLASHQLLANYLIPIKNFIRVPHREFILLRYMLDAHATTPRDHCGTIQ